MFFYQDCEGAVLAEMVREKASHQLLGGDNLTFLLPLCHQMLSLAEVQQRRKVSGLPNSPEVISTKPSEVRNSVLLGKMAATF